MEPLTSNSSYYAAIDLGSNSFHLWIVKKEGSAARTVTKIKRKVRLAAGLRRDGDLLLLDDDAFARGLACLECFAQEIAVIPKENVICVATAALRQAANQQQFLAQGKAVLGVEIQLISGEQEAALIYQGASEFAGVERAFHSSTWQNGVHSLVIDIGGASSELIIGKDTKPLLLTSLEMGCVTWRTRYFADDKLTEANFAAAIAAAKEKLFPIVPSYQAVRWQKCFGASGIMQSIHKILQIQDKVEQIDLALLHRLKAQLIDYQSFEKINISGLNAERAMVFPSGLAILIAIFECMQIKTLALAQGALREALLLQVVNRGPTLS
ncbi:MAG: hypothetical protein ACRC1U_05900 [Vibrionaceae bacterium]